MTIVAASAPLLVTLGDPNGLGPELACRFFATGQNLPAIPILLVGPERALEAHQCRYARPPFWTTCAPSADIALLEPGVYCITPEGLEDYVPRPGRASVDAGFAAGRSLEYACTLLRRNLASALVTLPLHKAMLNEAGFAFPGHTEFLARSAGLEPEDVCMHLCGDILRVSLVTTHPPLRAVADLITPDRIIRCLTLTADFLHSLGLDNKPVAVCGLNPHAGEQGRIGREEIETIAPAVERARALGIDAVGPLPADTLFYRASQGEFAAVLAMYHDQGLGPLKLLHFHQAVNVTLGLPFVRTSVDHGTGFDLTGRDVADLGSFRAALTLAQRLVAARQHKDTACT